jgi:uncharacterized membrane protein
MTIDEIHPLFIHFPLALLSVGILFDYLALVFQKESLVQAGWWNLVIGLVSATATIITGFIADSVVGHMEEDPLDIFHTHGSTQLLAITLFLVLFIWRKRLQGALPEQKKGKILYYFFGTVAVGILFYGGDLGARLAGRI